MGDQFKPAKTSKPPEAGVFFSSVMCWMGKNARKDKEREKNLEKVS